MMLCDTAQFSTVTFTAGTGGVGVELTFDSNGEFSFNYYSQKELAIALIKEQPFFDIDKHRG